MRFAVQAAPFASSFTFIQPDGLAIELWGEGDEFSAVFEHNGYAVVFDPARNAYMYARLNADGSELLPTRLEAGKADPAANGLPTHLRISPESSRAQRRARFERWDAEMEVTARWRAHKARMQAARSGGHALMASPGFETVGTKVGFTLLIDFDDDPATVPQAAITDFLNDDTYTGYGNASSVKTYFQDVSKGLLTYTNIVTAYVRIPNTLHRKSYYNNTSLGCGEQGNLLIKDALDILKASPGYQTDILPRLNALTLDGNGRAIAFNVFYAGGNGSVWNFGLWPHSWSLYRCGPQSLGNGVSLYKYQLTNIGSSLTLRTFCHENGHMLCGFPDFYDYKDDGTDSVGGTGNFCLMGTGGNDRNPVQIAAYMKIAAGWAEVADVPPGAPLETQLLASSLPGNPNCVYRFSKPGTLTEYYLLENRQKVGRDTGLPASGIAIWHIDERGDESYENLDYNTTHRNFEQTLVQADNLWHLHKFALSGNYGDANDLWFRGNSAFSYFNVFSDASSPSARWWDGSASGLRVSDFSASGNVMTFAFNKPATTRTLFSETFEAWNTAGWTQSGTAPSDWGIANGSAAPGRVPQTAHGGTGNICFYNANQSSSPQKRLITPVIDIATGVTNATLTFWVCKPNNRDSVVITYRTSPVANWGNIFSMGAAITDWMQFSVNLPNPSATCQISFEGTVDTTSNSGICIDDIAIIADILPTGYDIWKDEHFGPNANNSTIAADDVDSDGDGLPNLWEYITGRDPNDSGDAVGARLAIGTQGGYPSLTFPVGKQAENDGVMWDMVTCSDLSAGSGVPLNLDITSLPRSDSNTWWQVFYTDEQPARLPCRFYRLKVTVSQKYTGFP